MGVLIFAEDQWLGREVMMAAMEYVERMNAHKQRRV